jgi:hypothetical protein
MDAACPAHLILLNLIDVMMSGEEHNLLSSSLSNFLHHLATFPLLGPNIVVCTLFSNALTLCSSFNVRDQVSHPYKPQEDIPIYFFLF